MAIMRPLEPAYPSFTLVITQGQHPSDLFAYRRTRLKRRRSHPPSPQPRLEDPLMVTVDYRDQDPQAFPLLSWGGMPTDEETRAALSIDAALHTQPTDGCTPPPVRRKRLSLSSLVVVRLSHCYCGVCIRDHYIRTWLWW
ncbi:hypothetical protein JAAARDRAFT_374738 [Jaapia argillacea MUCL 33604]|uniref:Uncharacterized protein n=1 Tax=Jaapia argillacea MUCL 33604 TaxID=933084 RepID=A0A067Q8L1_9AGAM|nr:hypothetical protein JAAARDRAFT_374738 [Jaapia argillacea MUCL 33604]